MTRKELRLAAASRLGDTTIDVGKPLPPGNVIVLPDRRSRFEEVHDLARRILDLVATVPVDDSPAPKLLTLEQAAEALAVSRTTMQELVDGGEVAVVLVTGRAVRVDTRELEAFVKRKRERRG